MAREIQLTKGYVAIVDDEDYERVSQYNWCASIPDKRHVYAQARVDGRNVLLHRFLTGNTRWLVDHRNGNGLDNRRENLRLASDSNNAQNARKRCDNTSGVKGVHWNAATGKWRAQCMVAGVRRCLGRFDSLEAAADAVRAFREQRCGDFANHGEAASEPPDAKTAPRQLRADNTSGYRGVSWSKRKKKWLAQCKLLGKYCYLGWHDTAESAAEAVRAFRERNPP